MRTFALLTLSLSLTAGLTDAAQAAGCPAASKTYKATYVTYYEKADQPQSSTDPRCSIVKNAQGTKVCRIKMRGILFEPTAAPPAGNPYPAIVYNHGSGRAVRTTGDGRCVDNFFVPKGYVVLHPFRRGHGEMDTSTSDDEDTIAANTSTGRYFDDVISEFEVNPLGLLPKVPTACLPLYPDIHEVADCWQAKLVDDGADDAEQAFKWLAARPNVDKNAIAIMGSSYGAITSVLANRKALGHRAIVSFAAGSESWNHQEFVKDMLFDAAVKAQEPAFFLQAKWDVDTRPSFELALAMAESASDPRHGKRVQASIYDYPKPANDPETGEPDYESAHIGFSRAFDLWGPAVLDFLQRYGVK